MAEDFLGKFLALGCAFIWAFAVILFKRSGETVPPLALNLFKSTVAGAIFLPIWYWSDSPMIPASLSWSDLGALALSGIAGVTIADTLFFFCLNKLGAGYYAIIDCCYSPSMIFFSWMILGEPLTITHLIGASLVIAGILVITFEKRLEKHLDTRTFVTGAAAGTGAIVLMVLSIVAVKPLLDAHSAIMIVECRMIPAILVLHLTALVHKDRSRIYTSMIRSEMFRHAFPAAILGNVLSMLAWIVAFKYTDMGSASILNQMTVIFVIVLARVFLGEALTNRRLIATFLGFCGAVVVLSG